MQNDLFDMNNKINLKNSNSFYKQINNCSGVNYSKNNSLLVYLDRIIATECLKFS